MNTSFPSARDAAGYADEHALDIRFEAGVRLVGYRLSPDAVRAEDEVVLTVMWKREFDLSEDWLFFVHVQSGFDVIYGDPRRVSVATCLLGEVCAYEVHFRAPNKSQTLDVFAGLWRGAERMKIVRGPADDDRRAIVGRIPVAVVSGALK